MKRREMHRGRRGVAVAASLSLLFAAVAASAEPEGQARVRADLERFVRARVEGGPVTIDLPPLSVFSFDRARLPGPLRTEISSRAPRPFRGRVPVSVSLYAGDQLVKRTILSPYVRVTARVVVPSRDLAKGSLITHEDLQLVERDVRRVPTDAVDSIDAVVGLRAKRSIRRDRVVRLSQVERMPIVERGDRVTIVLQSGALKIQAIGRAQEAGAFGEWIRVLNVDSKREVSGRVDREGRIHVAF